MGRGALIFAAALAATGCMAAETEAGDKREGDTLYFVVPPDTALVRVAIDVEPSADIHLTDPDGETVVCGPFTHYSHWEEHGDAPSDTGRRCEMALPVAGEYEIPDDARGTRAEYWALVGGPLLEQPVTEAAWAERFELVSSDDHPVEDHNSVLVVLSDPANAILTAAVTESGFEWLCNSAPSSAHPCLYNSGWSFLTYDLSVNNNTNTNNRISLHAASWLGRLDNQRRASE